MRLTTLALAAAFALSSTFAFAAHRTHHHMSRMHSAKGSSSPNGTAGGATTLSGTGSSQYGGSVPGTTGKN